jgi:hypothetical protein
MTILDKSSGLAISGNVAGHLFEYLLQLSSHETDLKTLQTVSSDVKSALGDIEHADECYIPSHTSTNLRFSIVDEQNHYSIITCVCNSIKFALVDIDWCITHTCKAHSIFVSDQDQGGLEHQEYIEDTGIGRFEAACIARMSAIIEVVNTLNRCRVEQIAAAEAIMTATESMLKTIFGLIRQVTLNGKLPGADFDTMIQRLGSSVYRSIYDFIYYVVKCQESTSSRAEIHREARIIPNLVYQVERVEGLLIKAAQTTKQEFSRHIRVTTSRDFRIDITRLLHIGVVSPAISRCEFVEQRHGCAD